MHRRQEARAGGWAQGPLCSSSARRLGKAFLSASRQRKYTSRLWPMGSGTSMPPCARGVEFAHEKRLVGASGKNIFERLQVPRVMAKIRSRRSTSSAGERLAAVPEMSMPLRQRFDRVGARRLARTAWTPRRATRTSSRSPTKSPEKALGHRAAADVAGADEEDVFHKRRRARLQRPCVALRAGERTQNNLESNTTKSTRAEMTKHE